MAEKNPKKIGNIPMNWFKLVFKITGCGNCFENNLRFLPITGFSDQLLKPVSNPNWLRSPFDQERAKQSIHRYLLRISLKSCNNVSKKGLIMSQMANIVTTLAHAHLFVICILLFTASMITLFTISGIEYDVIGFLCSVLWFLGSTLG